MITTVKQANKITQDWVLQNVTSTVPYIFHPSNVTTPTPPPFDMPALGSWQLDEMTGEYSVLVEIPIDEMRAGEGDWEIAINYPSTQRYIEYFQQGHEPPPPFVVTNDKDALISCNRRRWLAAREAGVKMLKCWYSPTHETKKATPKWKRS